MPWTPDEDAVVFERYAIDGAKACAVSLGRSVASVKHRAIRLGAAGQKRLTDLDSVRARCEVEPESGCWLWLGAMKDGRPYGHMPGRQIAVRRFVWDQVHPDRPVADDQVVRAKCGRVECVAPGHMKAQRRKTLAQENARLKMSQHSRVAMTLSARARSKITADVAREILHSNDTERALAARFGISRVTVGRIRRGERWGPVAGVWAGLV